MTTIPVFGISDLHLPGFAGWALGGCAPPDPWQTLSDRWRQTVPAEAIMLLAGDLCHHPASGDARDGYRQISALPGAQKLAVPGNHDWPTASTPKQFRQTAALPGLITLLGSAARVPGPDGRGLIIAGTCGAWPTMNGGGRLRPCYHKELRRMRSALEHAGRLRQPGDSLILMTHYPPHSHARRPTSMSRLIESSGAVMAIYGHVHDRRRWDRQFQERRGGVEYRFVAADYLQLRPRPLGELTVRGFRLTC